MIAQVYFFTIEKEWHGIFSTAISSLISIVQRDACEYTFLIWLARTKGEPNRVLAYAKALCYEWLG